ncbi:MAG TPA: hypothetical protein VF412_13585 [Bdellovibrio sp.]|uniref:hypothetical protein n=1 Tax=Bdellovibrio sp. TaxID=28201 RepID=UPI002EE8DF88
MLRILEIFGFSVLFYLVINQPLWAATLSKTTASSVQQGKPASADLMRCVYTPDSSSQTSSLPTSLMGFKFYLEPNNNNEIAVDIYTVNADSKPIKQVGHAELATETALSSSLSSSSLASALTSLELAEDSPFEFLITFASGVGGERFSGVIETTTTFFGEVYTKVPVQCRLAPQGKAAAQDANSASGTNVTP